MGPEEPPTQHVSGIQPVRSGYPPRVIKDFGAGVALLLRGFKLVFSSPKRVLMGALPAVITAALMITGWVLLFLYIVIVSFASLAAGLAIFWKLEPRLAEEL